MSANVAADGTVSQLDRRPEPDENITDEAVKDPSRLAKFLLRLFRDVALLKRRWAPRRMDFDVVSTGTELAPQTVHLAHHSKGPVVWWVTRVTNPGVVTAYLIYETSASTDDVLVLKVYYPATFRFRVEEAG